MNENVKVYGTLQKTFVPSMNGYKYTCSNGVKTFKTFDEACKYADKIADLTGTIVTIK